MKELVNPEKTILGTRLCLLDRTLAGCFDEDSGRPGEGPNVGPSHDPGNVSLSLRGRDETIDVDRGCRLTAFLPHGGVAGGGFGAGY
jgi:hypothetical protein